MNHSFARTPEFELADRRDRRRRVLIVVLVLATIAAALAAWIWINPYFRSTPQPTEPRTLDVDGERRVVAMSLSRSGTMSGSPPFTISVCTDATVVCDIEDLRNDRWEVVRRSTDRATPDQLARLERAFSAADFANLRTDYSRPDITCAPWFSIYRYDGITPRLIRLYAGDRSVPESLGELIDEFFDTFSIERWLDSSRDPLPESSETR